MTLVQNEILNLKSYKLAKVYRLTVIINNTKKRKKENHKPIL